MRAFFLYVLFFSFSVPLFSQSNSSLLDSIIKANPALKKIFASKNKYFPQIIYTQINRDEQNRPSFVNHTLLLDSSFFYPASLVKLPLSIFSLEKINELAITGLDENTAMLTDSAAICQKRTWKDSASINGFPSLGLYIKKMLLVSDNDGYSRVLEFVNPKYIKARFIKFGFSNARLTQRFDLPCIDKGNRYMNPVRFVNNENRAIYSQALDSVTGILIAPSQKIVLGKNIYSKRKKLISGKKDFSNSNFLPLSVAHSVLQNLVFNKNTSSKISYNLKESDWRFLMKHLGMYPRENESPKYDPEVYDDSFKKYFIYGGTVKKVEQDTLRIFNIVGKAYGFLSDCAYIVNMNSGVEFLLSASIYTNKRNSFGSGIYEYEEVGLPFLKELSIALYRLESNRKNKRLPDLKFVDFYK